MLSGLWGCPGYQAGGHVDLAMPTIDCECVGENIPPPFVLDVSRLELEDACSVVSMRPVRSVVTCGVLVILALASSHP
eukprot:1465890-Amphidinium_carterae.1